MKNNKKIIEEFITDFYGSVNFDDIIKYKKEGEELILKSDVDGEWGSIISLYVRREETDEEFKERIDQLLNSEKYFLEREKKEYERLKKKFG